MGVEVRPVSAEDVRPLRHAVLRPHQPPEELVYPGDDAPETLHAAAVGEEGAIVGIATVSREGHPVDPREGDWRIRGMASAPEARGRGIGGRLLAMCLAHAARQGGERVWCNARTPARHFYESAFFVVEGEEFEIEGIGPHLLMSRSLL